ncbi:MAG TPA: SIS domain-containing protein [Gammaproteobacteria bacterium]|nr:SIS domain-containing protein [Gammaproteobacteria bacterium]
MKSLKAVASLKQFFSDYASRLQAVLAEADWSPVEQLAEDLHHCWLNKRQVFICGNGGSAGNAIHLANDFIYGVAKSLGGGLRVQALSANPAILTCLANDVGYDRIYSEQLAVQAEPEDLLLVLSGSGNSPNILAVLQQAKAMQVKSYAILGYSGGRSKDLADVAIYFPVDDMQIAEDLQLIVGHMLMQWLYTNRPSIDVEEKEESLYA